MAKRTNSSNFRNYTKSEVVRRANQMVAENSGNLYISKIKWALERPDALYKAYLSYDERIWQMVLKINAKFREEGRDVFMNRLRANVSQRRRIYESATWLYGQNDPNRWLDYFILGEEL